MVSLDPALQRDTLLLTTVIIRENTERYFPRPGRVNRSPDVEAQIEGYLEALEAADLEEQRVEELRENVEKGFERWFHKERLARKGKV